MIYRLVDILEDIDFGCEEREGELPLMAVAVLEDPDNNKIRFKMPDALFTKRGLQAGDSVYIDEDDTLRKAITSPDWTKEFGSKDIDVAGFVRDMADLVNGRKKKWICPFCGGHIVVLGKDGDENHIGCDSCDMRIDLSATLM